MSALQLWLQNHNRKLTQAAIDEALMEYIKHVEKQRDGLVDLLLEAKAELIDDEYWEFRDRISAAIASVKEKA